MKRLTVLMALVAVLVAACSSTPEARPLSEQEAELLAVIRFTNYSDRVVAFRGQVPSSAGTLMLDGRVDFARSVGYATLRTAGETGHGSAGVLQWSRAALAFLAGAGPAADPPPGGTWQLRQMQGGELDTALALLLGLGKDRPDNAQLLRQSEARWLRSDTVDTSPVDVFEGPRGQGRAGAEAPRLRYWVDSGARLRRVEARIGLAQDAASFDFTPGAAPFTAMPELSN
jgi:hypothetical protein